MQFFFESEEAAERGRDYAEFYKDVVFACTLCASENTVETDELTPSGVHYKVLCENGHLFNGMPPRGRRYEDFHQVP
ncbi:hypothetical protein [Kitasatospora sp. MBT66]|uniref:hypothetical protein n=1 Tax=Kitasatospora sp. MBT66 TaxID=1444769 RepID=UPI0005B84190|nr:hypothetical protein [Kitasatospora sp. MBT66]